MLKEHWRTISRIERIGDILIIIACFFGAYYGRASLLFWNETLQWGLPFEGEVLLPIKDYFIVLLVALLGYTALLHSFGAYNSMRLRSSWEIFRLSAASSLLVFIMLAAVLFMLKMDFSRSFIVLFCILVGLTLTLQRAIALEFLRYWRRRGRNFRNIVIAGTGHQAIEVAEHILRRPELGIRVRGFVDLREDEKKGQDEVHLYRERFRKKTGRRLGRFLEGTESLQKALKNYAIDEIIFTDIISVMSQVEESVLICAEQGVRTTIAADLFSVGMVKSEMSFFGGMPLIHFETPPGDRWELSLKRVFDFCVALLALLLLSPFFLLIAFLVKVSSPGPVLFVQKRVGQNGRLFDLYKFRSMDEDAETKLGELQEFNEMSGPVFKMESDPRVTPIGKFLRRFSLDELPQLWNVLIGDMSLVGPRPPVPGEVGLYKPKDRRRLSMRPGLTCTWQVSGRNEISDFESWVQMDLEYIDNWSLGRDLGLILRTIPAVLFGTGAR